MNELTYDEPLWIRSAYGADAVAALSRLGPAASHIEHAVGKFYESLKTFPGAVAVLDNLTAEEFQHLHVMQGRYLTKILSPELSAKHHRQMAIEAGLRHSYVGLSAELLTESSILYRDIVATLIPGASEAEPLREIITQRFQYDLITQIEAYALIQKNRLETYQLIARQEHTANPLDFVQNTLNALLASFHEDVIGVAFGCVKNGNFRHLLAKGRVPLSSGESSMVPEIQQAWFDEKPLIINSLSRDTQLSAALRNECMCLGIRSLGLMLMRDLQGSPKAYLLICGLFPGYFLNDGTRHYWQQVADFTGVNLDFMERSHSSRRHRLADGLRFRQLLAQEKVEMHYQPIVDPKSGRTVKVEALARLKDGDRIISPGLFLPAFGAHQLRELFDIGLLQIMDKLSDKYPVCSINIPTEVMSDTVWMKSLLNHLAGLGADPGRISLEILESSLSDNKEVQNALYAIKEAGYSIFLDDVGAGESSLLRLATLPVSGIKIDQSFVRSLQNNFEYLDFILSLRSLAAQRGLECIAEGVENADIVDTLGSVSGLQLQGYAFAKPMPANALLSWIEREAEGMPLGPFPQSLYGWYCRHVDRFISIRNALYTASDLISIEQLQNAECCPLHAIIPHIGGDFEIDQAHRKWHESYARFTSMIQEGVSLSELWHAMESCKQELRLLIERKLHATKR